MIYFTSDTHFNHKNIIEYCDRPFRTADGQLDVKGMDDALVNNWNARVTESDIVYHLGDFYMGPGEGIAGYRARLRGHIILVRGNHDRSPGKMRAAGFDVCENALVNVSGAWIYLRHKPDLEFARTKLADYHFHGHVHNEYKRRDNLFNVGVDVRDFKPWTFEEILSDSW